MIPSLLLAGLAVAQPATQFCMINRACSRGVLRIINPSFSSFQQNNHSAWATEKVRPVRLLKLDYPPKVSKIILSSNTAQYALAVCLASWCVVTLNVVWHMRFLHILLSPPCGVFVAMQVVMLRSEYGQGRMNYCASDHPM